MVHWNSSPHPISDIRDWKEAGRLELQPDFQRREVWSSPARIMLMDTILRGIPMPKIFLSNIIRDGKTYRIVIDGQQRITAILDFLQGKFSMEKPYTGDNEGKTFSELDQETQNRFLSYQIDFNEAVNASEKEAREVYARVNKYTVPLTKQELRRADLPGDFLDVSEELAINEYLNAIGIFTPANRRRYADVEYVSELLAAMIDGIQDKKSTLDSFYIKYASWESGYKDEIVGRFSGVLNELRHIFNDTFKISGTRFRQKADFYTLFLLIDELVSKGHTIEQKEIQFLRDDLKTLDETIYPESYVEICSEYAIKCVSQANSASSRRWRRSFLKPILEGTYLARLPDNTGAKVFYRLMNGLSMDTSILYCPVPLPCCPSCEEELPEDFAECVIAWCRGAVYQIANAEWVHCACVVEESGWMVLELPNDDQLNLF